MNDIGLVDIILETVLAAPVAEHVRVLLDEIGPERLRAMITDAVVAERTRQEKGNPYDEPARPRKIDEAKSLHLPRAALTAVASVFRYAPDDNHMIQRGYGGCQIARNTGDLGSVLQPFGMILPYVAFVTDGYRLVFQGFDVPDRLSSAFDEKADKALNHAINAHPVAIEKGAVRWADEIWPNVHATGPDVRAVANVIPSARDLISYSLNFDILARMKAIENEVMSSIPEELRAQHGALLEVASKAETAIDKIKLAIDDLSTKAKTWKGDRSSEATVAREKIRQRVEALKIERDDLIEQRDAWKEAAEKAKIRPLLTGGAARPLISLAGEYFMRVNEPTWMKKWSVTNAQHKKTDPGWSVRESESVMSLPPRFVFGTGTPLMQADAKRHEEVGVNPAFLDDMLNFLGPCSIAPMRRPLSPVAAVNPGAQRMYVLMPMRID